MVLGHNLKEGLRTRDVRISEDVTFDTMLLAGKTLKGLLHSGFHKPSPIQLHAIPLGKCGFDLLLEAKSGTGKTAVFTVIALEKLDLAKDLQALILAPTREIAAQICDVIKQIGSSYQGLNIEVLMGGLPIKDDIEKLKNKVHIIVGSPGRVRHLVQDNHINTSSVRLLVLDEADKLMDKSFQADINYIFSTLPKQKQVIMSSATYPEALTSLIQKYVTNAQHICPDTTSVLLGIRQFTTSVKSNTSIIKQTKYRFSELLNILSKKQFRQCLIFCNYQARVKELSKMMTQEKWPVEQLHGQQDQVDRLDALKTLQEYKCRILISTDLAARGIDASNVDLVINFEPPCEWQTYLHRIGRAGRFGSYGEAITILSEGQEQERFKKLINAINGSLEIRNFWDDEKYNLSDSDASNNVLSDISVTQEVVDEAVSNMLTESQEVTTNGEIQSFEKLLASFGESKDDEIKIESFNDLLTSYEYHKVGNTEVVKITHDDHLDNLVGHTGKVEVSKLNAIEKNSVFNTKDSNGESAKDITKNVQNNHTKQQNKKKDSCVTNSTEDYNISSKALIDAGLPTEFSSRPQNTKPKISYSKHSNVSTNSKPVKVSNKEQYHLEPRLCETSLEEHGSKNADYYNTESLKFNRSSKTHKDLYERKNCNTKSFLRKSYNRGTIFDDISNSTYKEYVKWYNQLKCHVNQIQMAVYIEELSSNASF